MDEIKTGSGIQISKTRNVPNPTYYIQALQGEFSQWAFDEERAPTFRGKWRSEAFQVGENAPLDLEIGTGNGYHFAHYAEENPRRSFVGIELKYKPLIQAIRRAVLAGCENARIMRYNAKLLSELFAPRELNDVIIHHPDPFPKKKHHKHRLITEKFLKGLHHLQKPGSTLFFKTDSEEYFDWSMERFAASPYHVIGATRDLHNSEYAVKNFVTSFEKLFLAKGQPIFYAEFRVGGSI